MEVHTIKEGADEAHLPTSPWLLPHQRASLKAMMDIERNCGALPLGATRGTFSTRMALLSDKPGAGKSYTITALLRSDSTPACPPLVRQVSSTISATVPYIQSASADPSLDLSLLVVPHNIIRQWAELIGTISSPGEFLLCSRMSHMLDAREAVDAAAVAAGNVGCPSFRGPADGSGSDDWSSGGSGSGSGSGSSDDGVLAEAGAIGSAAPQPEQPRARFIVCTPATFRELMDHVRAKKLLLRRIVFDEADSIKLEYPNHIDQVTRFYWFVTASPQQLFALPEAMDIITMHTDAPVIYYAPRGFAKSTYIRGFFYFQLREARSLLPVILASITLVCDNPFIDRSFRTPRAEERLVNCRSPRCLVVLQNVIDRQVLDRINAGDIGAAMEYLGAAGAQNEDNIVSAASQHIHREIHNLRADLAHTVERLWANEDDKQKAVLRKTAAIDRELEKLAALRARIETMDTCPICFGGIDTKSVVPCCSNSFCLGCIMTWLLRGGSACPMCKTALQPAQLIVVRPTAADDAAAADAAAEAAQAAAEPPVWQHGVEGLLAENSKETNLRSIIHYLGARSQPAKILIFSDNDYTMNTHVSQVLHDAGMQFSMVKGNSNVVAKRVRDFSESTEPRALLVNCQYYGSGTNLSAATDIILMHDLGAIYEQVVGRAQRPPRTAPLTVWKLAHGESGEAY